MEKRGRKWSPKYTRYDVSSTLTVDTNNHGIKKETSIKFLTPGKKIRTSIRYPTSKCRKFPSSGIVFLKSFRASKQGFSQKYFCVESVILIFAFYLYCRKMLVQNKCKSVEFGYFQKHFSHFNLFPTVLPHMRLWFRFLYILAGKYRNSIFSLFLKFVDGLFQIVALDRFECSVFLRFLKPSNLEKCSYVRFANDPVIE